MPKIRCKSLNKDGTPCQGHGQPQYDGFCIAHAPAGITQEWRSRGGKASSSAARAEKRIPEHLRRPIEMVTQGMEDLVEGKIQPAALSALSRAARTLADLHRLADADMELIRDEEFEAAAAQAAGGFGNPDLLDKAAAIVAWQRRYTIESLIAQGLVKLESAQTGDEAAPVQPVLTDAGRRRFGYQRLTSYTQEDIDALKEEIMNSIYKPHELRAVRGHLARMRTALEEAARDLAHDPGPVRDPLTGQVLDKPPAGVKVGELPAGDPGESENAADILQSQRRQVIDLTRQLEDIYLDMIREEKLFGPQEAPTLSELSAALHALSVEDSLPPPLLE